MKSYLETYTWLKNFKCRQQSYKNKNYYKYELVSDESKIVYRGDTMTSIFTTLKEYIKLKMRINKIDEKSWEIYMLKNYNKLDLSDEAGNFLALGHTIGNFIPVPGGFNTGRANDGKGDYWDLTLSQIYQWYKDNGRTQEESKDGALDKLFVGSKFKNKSNVINNCKEWLNKFKTWEEFVKQNYMESFIDNDGVPIQFFKGHSLEHPVPKTIDEFEEFFKTVNYCISSRGKKIEAILSEKNYNGTDDTID